MDKAEKLRELLRGYGSLAVAFSGGTDSAWLLYAAREALGARVLALTADSALIPRAELESSSALCDRLGVRQHIIRIDALALPQVRDNPTDRCYHCKKAIFTRLHEQAQREGYTVLADGSNADDTGDYRPGMRALAELGVRSPLREAGLTKAEIRAFSRDAGLPTWNKPAAACLASRIPYGVPLDEKTLSAVERAEEALHALGIAQCRVRVHGALARLELPPSELGLLADEALRDRIAALIRSCGFAYVALDLEGYRTGSLNEVIKMELGN